MFQLSMPPGPKHFIEVTSVNKTNSIEHRLDLRMMRQIEINKTLALTTLKIFVLDYRLMF